jgi:hypothetical protein
LSPRGPGERVVRSRRAGLQRVGENRPVDSSALDPAVSPQPPGSRAHRRLVVETFVDGRCGSPDRFRGRRKRVLVGGGLAVASPLESVPVLVGRGLGVCSSGFRRGLSGPPEHPSPPSRREGPEPRTERKIRVKSKRQKLLSVWKKIKRSVRARPGGSGISTQRVKSLMEHVLVVRTGLGANRRATAQCRAIRALSTDISTAFSTAVSEN